MARKSLAIVLHDVAPATWPRYRSFVAEVDRLGEIPLTLLVVPNYHRQGLLTSQSAFCAEMDSRRQRGDELVLHGYAHQDELPLLWSPVDYCRRRIFTHEGEFYPLTAAMAHRRLQAGIELFRRLGWPLTGFVAPAWLLGAGSRAALAATPLRYTSDPGNLYRLPTFTRIPAPTLVWSAGSRWRRGASWCWNEARRRRHQAAPLLRLGLHPVDMEHRFSRHYWLATLEKLLASRQPVTKAAWLEAHR
ncbi:MAG: polysaccharide deacetylase family protein [Deltaproteobacteria bacterium]|nr:polysaccharide deacetylase family protein [Deltaproteobacteria bacterium]